MDFNTFATYGLLFCISAGILLLNKYKTNFLATLACFTASVLTLPVSLPVTGLVYLYSTFIKMKLRKKYGDKITFMENLDVVWAMDSPEARCVINGLMLLEGKPDINEIRREWKTKLCDKKTSEGKLKFPRFFQYMKEECGYHFWHWEEEFKIEEHINYLDSEVTEERLEEIIGEMSNAPFANEKSPWEVHVVPSVVKKLKHIKTEEHGKSDSSSSSSSSSESETEEIPEKHTTPKYAVIFRIHHSMADGVSLVFTVLTSLCDTYDIAVPNIFSKISLLQRLGIFVWNIFCMPFSLLRHILKVDNNPLHGQMLCGEKHVALSDAVDINLIKAIKNKAKVTVNDVLLSCLAGCLQTHFLSYCQYLPQSIIGAIPISLRTSVDDMQLNNKFSIGYLTIPTENTGPEERLMATRINCNAMKWSPQIMALYWAFCCMGVLPSSSVAKSLCSTKQTTVIVSNVPGPQERICFWGHKILDVLFWLPHKDTTGVGLSIASYAGSVKVGLIVDKALIADRKTACEMMNNFPLEIKKLYNAVVVKETETL